MKRMTLQEANEYLRRNGIEIAWDNSLSLTDFFGYYFKHYAPNLDNQKIGKFFADDMRNLFGTEWQDESKMQF